MKKTTALFEFSVVVNFSERNILQQSSSEFIRNRAIHSTYIVLAMSLTSISYYLLTQILDQERTFSQ